MNVNWLGDRINSLVDDAIHRRMTAMGEKYVAAAVARAPQRSGYLKSTIGFTYHQGTMTLQLHADAPYALFVEFGTRWMLAHPYLRPAVNASAQVWGSTIELQFPNTPNLAGTKRPHGVVAGQSNRASAARYSKTRAGKAKVTIHRGKWNGPKNPWQ